MLRQLITDNRRVFGTSNPNTHRGDQQPSALLRKRKNYTDAEQLFRECLRLEGAVRRPRNAGTIAYACNLGLALQQLGRYQDAESWMRQSFEMSRDILGTEHPTMTLLAMSSLGSIQQFWPDSTKRTNCLALVWKPQKRVIGPNHSQTSGHRGADRRHYETCALWQIRNPGTRPPVRISGDRRSTHRRMLPPGRGRGVVGRNSGSWAEGGEKKGWGGGGEKGGGGGRSAFPG